MINTQIDLPLDQIVAFCERYPIQKLSLFGSVLREDFGPDSDIDVLVEFEPAAKIGYFEMADMQFELETILGRPVDLLTPGALSQYFKQKVLDTAQVIYERG
jgi:predicted nucleotidyltransferase